MSTVNLTQLSTRCLIQGCQTSGKVVRGFCPKHYSRLRMHGNPLVALRNHGEGADREIRFWSRATVTDDVQQCWEWMHGFDRGGYGQLRLIINGRVWRKASRIAYYFHYKSDPGDLLVLHKCDNRKCINPHHLFLGTHKENTDDMIAKGRMRTNRGEDCGRSKLTEADVRIIKGLLRDGHTQSQIAERFGISASAVGHIRQGSTWRHV